MLHLDNMQNIVDTQPLSLEEEMLLRGINYQKTDERVQTLMKLYEEGDLLLSPHYQRKYRWDKVKASELILSLLVGMPLPLFYFSRKKEGNLVVVDGKQRLTTIIYFILGRWPKDNKTFRISLPKEHKSALKDKTFEDLPIALQNKIKDKILSAIIINEPDRPEVEQFIFKAINQKATPLTNEEIRNCVYAGPYMDFIKYMSVNPTYIRIMNFRPGELARMFDVNIVHRWSAFLHAGPNNYVQDLTNFLDADMDAHRHTSKEDLYDLDKLFCNGLENNIYLFGDNSFRRFIRGNHNSPNGYFSPSINKTVFEIMMWLLCKVEKKALMRQHDALEEGMMHFFCCDPQFTELLDRKGGIYHTGITQKRFALAEARFQDILLRARTNEYAYTKGFKASLLQDKSKGRCLVCDTPIQSVDDACIYKVPEYWLGLKISTNQKDLYLAHRYCYCLER